MLFTLFILTVCLVHIGALDYRNVSEPMEACRARNDTVHRCIFTYLHHTEDFNIIHGEHIKWLEIYFETDILRGVLPNGSFSKLPQLKGLLIHGHYAQHISSGAFDGLTNLIMLTLTHDVSYTFLMPAADVDDLPADRVNVVEYNSPSPQYVSVDELPPSTFGQGWLEPLSHLEILNLQYNNIRSFTRREFCGKFLSNLDLKQNNITNIEDIGFECNESQTNKSVCHPCQTLAILNLADNFISELKGIVTCNSSKLIHLYLENNKLKFISEAFFSCNTQLESLDLSGNLLHGDMLVTAGLGNLHRLETLSLSGNRIQTLSSTILVKMKELRYFYCNNCQMKTISDGAFWNIPKLDRLKLNHNLLNIQGSDSFKVLTRLDTLELVGNELLEFDTSTVLPTLKYLNIGENQLPHIPDLSGPWHGLTHLDLSYNNISIFEHMRLTGLIHLNVLVLSFNHISHIPMSGFLSWGSEIMEINMGNNHIQNIPYKAFLGASQLVKLSLENNKLTEISGWLVIRARYVMDFNASWNKIDVFDMRYFPQSIQTIDLSWNKISIIKESISSLPNLRILNLSYNKLHKLGQGSLAMVPATVPRPQVFLAGNRLHCDCNLDWLMKIESRSSLPEVPDLDLVYCESPMIHANRSFATLSVWNLVCPYKTECNNWSCKCCNQDVIGGCKCRASCYDQCECFHKHDQSINVVNCSSRNMSYLPPEGPTYVQKARLDDNNLTILTASMFKFPYMKQLLLNKSHVSHIEPGTFLAVHELQVLYLQDNEIQSLEAGSFAHLFYVKTLWLHNNKLTHINLDLFNNMESLQDLTLHGNPWTCDCHFVHPFHKWLVTNSKIISNIKTIQCNGSGGSQSLLETDFSFCVKKAPVVELVSMVAACVGAGILVVLFHRKRLLLRVWAYNQFGVRLRRHSEDEDNERRPFDVFIGRSEHSDDFVFVYFTILPELEQPTGRQRELAYRVCEEWRNWPGGATVTDMTIASVEQSKRTILLISEHYFDSIRAQYIFHAAHNQVLNDGQRRLILVLLDSDLTSRMDRTMSLYMKTGLTLIYGEPNFWGKLRYYLADNPRGR